MTHANQEASTSGTDLRHTARQTNSKTISFRSSLRGGALLAMMLIPMISSVSQCGHLMCPTADDSAAAPQKPLSLV